MTGDTSYVGRFAPSPTGPLHFGSLLAACASYLDARSNSGRWLLRIEDIDPPREQPGATEAIIRALEAFGFEWDGPTIYQSESQAAHFEALERLRISGHTYPCGCSRRDLADEAHGPLGVIYPGTCRTGTDAEQTATRVRVDGPMEFEDGLQGMQRMHMQRESGDFVVLRKDGLIAYHLAVVVDDFLEGINHIVRGIDLMDSTPRQIWLQQLLGYPTPRYLHIPVAVHGDGDKLSKLTGARELDTRQAPRLLWTALQRLQQDPPGALQTAPLAEIWDWAIVNWDRRALIGRNTVSGYY